MEFRCEGRVDAPVEVVYAIIRDDLISLVPFLDNVAAITELERKPGAAGRTSVLNRWRAEQGNVPSAVRPFLKPEMLEWLDHAEWSDAESWVDWWIEAPTFRDLYKCKGRNHIQADGTGTRIAITGELTVDPTNIPGVPGFVGRKMAPMVENYLVERIRPNLAGLAVGVNRYMSAKK